ncbi:MAG TPA: ACT domain-containing protein, partial [Negativicutes bacterium]
MKVVITIVGQDQVGIIAMASGILAESNINIL